MRNLMKIIPVSSPIGNPLVPSQFHSVCRFSKMASFARLQTFSRFRQLFTLRGSRQIHLPWRREFSRVISSTSFYNNTGKFEFWGIMLTFLVFCLLHVGEGSLLSIFFFVIFVHKWTFKCCNAIIVFSKIQLKSFIYVIMQYELQKIHCYSRHGLKISYRHVLWASIIDCTNEHIKLKQR